MTNVEELLRIPSLRKRNYIWERLITGDILFQSLFQFPQNTDRIKSIGKAREWVKNWEHKVEHLHDLDTDLDEESRTRLRIERKMEWHKVDKLTWCAEQAITHADFYRTRKGQACFASKKVPEFIKQDKVWTWVCIRTFLKMPYRRIEIPIALWDEGQDEEGGFLATLCLEVIESGTGLIAHHPIDIFSTCMDETFREAMEAAWDSAKNLIQKKDKEVPYDGRWRILQKNGQPLPIVKGRSASGAAALGWYHLLRGTIPDEGIIVMAQIDHEGRLQGVDGIRAKAKAIAKDRGFDTVVVASGENKNQVSECLDNLVNQKCIDVKIYESQTIENLIKIRSQRAKYLLSYFEKIEEILSKDKLLELGHKGRTLDKLRIPLYVVPYDPVQDIEEAKDSEHFRQKKRFEEEGDQQETDRRIYAQRTLESQEDKKALLKKEQLNEVEAKMKVAIIVGDPGSGKTEWLKARVRHYANDALKNLEEYKNKLEEIHFPIYLPLPEISEELHKEENLKDFLVEAGLKESRASDLSESEKLAAAMLMVLINHDRPNNPQLSKQLAQWAWKRMFGAGTPMLICLDAWDETRFGHKHLADCLHAFSVKSGSRILITSRIIGYDPNLLQIDNKSKESNQVLQLCPFEWSETEKFVSEFFKDDPPKKDKMIEELRAKIPIAGMAQNPLLATLLCMAFDNQHLKLPAKRGEVYKCILKGLLLEWKHLDKKTASNAGNILSAKIELLEEIAFKFFPDNLIDKDSLDKFLWDADSRYMINLDNTNPLKQVCTKASVNISSSKIELINEIVNFVSPYEVIDKNYLIKFLLDKGSDCIKQLDESDNTLIKILCDDGILVPYGRMNEEKYKFLHKTFQECLVASSLARRANENGFQEVKDFVDKKAWDPKWQDVIVFMAGALKDPFPLLKLLSNKKNDDLFRHRLALAVLCLPEISSTTQNLQNLLNDITTEYFIFWIKSKEHENKNVVPHFIKGLPALGQANARIYNTVNFKKAIRGRWPLSGIFGKTFGRELRYSIFGKAFKKAFKNVVAKTQEGLPFLDCISKLMQDEDFYVQYEATKVYWEIGSVAKSYILDRLGSFKNSPSNVFYAALHLMEISIIEARPDILDRLVQLLQDENRHVPYAAAEALVRSINSAEAFPFADIHKLLLQNENRHVQYTAAEAVGKIGSAATRQDILNRLVLLWQDKDPYARYVAGQTLKQFLLHGIRIFRVSRKKVELKTVKELSQLEAESQL